MDSLKSKSTLYFISVIAKLSGQVNPKELEQTLNQSIGYNENLTLLNRNMPFAVGINIRRIKCN